MIRFCDKDKDCIELDSVNKQDLLEHFCSNHEDDVLCVYDNFTKMEYIGIITYRSLQQADDSNDVIIRDYVILDENIWLNARNYFSHYRYWYNEHVLLPVLDKEGGLVCFAYEDAEANREIRMLRELSEMPNTLQFTDLYPESSVKIYGFNELAYYFAKYLVGIGIEVGVDGEMWRDFFPNTVCSISNYKCFAIYAEGIHEDGVLENWTEELLKSVSVEFECIDKIYEANIENRRIMDADGEIQDLLTRLRGEKEIIIYGTGRKEQDAYNYFMENGIDVCCFVGMNYDECSSHKLFGKNIISGLEARNTYKNAIFIDCISRHSAWGFGRIDYYDYIGYRRNRQFIVLEDYVQVQKNSLFNVLQKNRSVLLGDEYLCSRLFEYFKENQIWVEGYVNILSLEYNQKQMPRLDIEDINSEVICLIVDLEFFDPAILHTQERIELKQRIIAYLKEKGIKNYSDYFSYLESFIRIEENVKSKYNRASLLPKKIVIGSIEGYNGKTFFRDLLDGHPSIMMIHYNKLNDDLFWICSCLSMEKGENILPLFWQMCDKNILDNPDLFREKMEFLLQQDNKYTSQELFVMIHIAYMYMYGMNIKEEDVKNMVIYWEPHFIERDVLEDCVGWLRVGGLSCDIINIVRNMCMVKGSLFKGMMEQEWCRDKRIACYSMLSYPSVKKKNFIGSHRLVVRFEDLKCNPLEKLGEICEEWGIPWSDTLMETTYKGGKHSYNNIKRGVEGFDLEPVYNIYEEYFTEFDRFRMMLLSVAWQKAYGYPYVEAALFSKRELQDMFCKKFHFENFIMFDTDKEEFEYRLHRQSIIGSQVWLISCLEDSVSV